MADKRITGNQLNALWSVGAQQSRYSEWGNWYSKLTKFPGALFDSKGFILFRNEEDYLNCPALEIRKQVNVTNGISSIAGYVHVLDTPIEVVGIEGAEKIRIHRFKERNRALVIEKRQSSEPECEVCSFNFLEFYGIDYCEVHHLAPLASLTEETQTRLSDLAILCANCHRAVHSTYPPLSLDQLLDLIVGSSSAKAESSSGSAPNQS